MKGLTEIRYKTSASEVLIKSFHIILDMNERKGGQKGIIKSDCQGVEILNPKNQKLGPDP